MDTEVHEDFSFGVNVTYATLDLEADTESQVVDPLELFLDPGHPRLPGQSTSDVYETRIDGTDSALAFAVGVHWHPDSIYASRKSPWSFGAVYRRGARFTVPESTYLNEIQDEVFSNELVVPDQIAVAASYRLGANWLFAAEIERVEYSHLLDGFRSGVNVLTSQRITEGSFGIDPEKTVEFTVDDAYVPRVGVEYARGLGARQAQRIAFRAGYFRTPDDQIRKEHHRAADRCEEANGGVRGSAGGGPGTRLAQIAYSPEDARKIISEDRLASSSAWKFTRWATGTARKTWTSRARAISIAPEN